MDPNNSNKFPFYDMFGNPIDPNSFNSPMSQYSVSNPNLNFNSPNPYYSPHQYYRGADTRHHANYTRMMMDLSTNDPSTSPEPATPNAGSNPTPNVPLFSTQHPMEDEASSPQKKPAKGEWTTKEDKLLISAWLNTSKDSITGNQQKSNGFWKKIKAYYDDHWTPAMPDRGDYGVFKNRWYRMSAAVNKFGGCYSRIVQRNQSGQSEADRIACAQQLYKDENKKNFTAMHAWRILRNETKWQSEYDQQPVVPSSSKRTKNSASGAYTSSSNAGSAGPHPVSPTDDDWVLPRTHAERPIGQKAAKRKEKETERSTPQNIEELNNLFGSFQDNNKHKYEAIAEVARAKATEVETRLRIAEVKARDNEMKRKQKQYEIDMQVLARDTSTMDPETLALHKMVLAKIRKRLAED